MESSYSVRGKDYFTSEVNDVILDESATRRLIFRPEIVRNETDATASVHGYLMYQRRSATSASWEDEPPIDLRKVRSGEAVGLYLDAAEAQRLYEELGRLYQLPLGSPGTTVDYVIVDANETYVATGKRKELIERLISEEGDNFWDHIEELSPGLVNSVSLKREYQARKATVEEFEKHLAEGDWTEPDWQKFFRKNTWIFGHHLAFQFICLLEEQAYVGGKTLTGKGGQDLDFMMHTEAEARFTLVVDIKRPDAELVEEKQYRNKVHQPGKDVTGGVGQVQSYCRRWVIEGSQQEDNREFLRQHGISTFEPRGILIVGHLGQLDTADKLASFEMYRRNTHNPEIVTFDELLTRAKYTVERMESKVKRDEEVPTPQDLSISVSRATEN